MSYRKKHIKNKIHKITRKKPTFKNSIFWISVLLVILVFASLYFLLFFSGCQVENIIIFGNEKIKTTDIKNLVSKNIAKKIISIGILNIESKSIFLTNPPELQKMILNTFPIIESVTIEKKFPQSINLKISERKPVAVFCQPDQNGKCFFIDKNGVIFEELQNIPQNIAIIKQLLNNNEVFTGENIIGKNIMDLISKIEAVLRDNFQINITEALVADPIRLDVKTSENWQIYFNLNSNTDLQIIKLNSLLKDEISKTSRASLQYIDLRFGDRAYYK